MKIRILLALTSVLLWGKLDAQISQDVKDVVDAFPKKINSTTSFALLINKNFKKNDRDKVGGIYYWMATNVVFNTKEHFSDKDKVTYSFRYKTQEEKEAKIQKVNREIAEQTFQTKKAVAKEFAFLFEKLCVNSGVECVTIEGTSKSGLKDIGRKAGRVNHYWNAVKLQGKWQLLDVTWGAGELYEESEYYVRTYSEAYFLIEPSLFYLNHYPKKGEWLFLNKTREDFGLIPLFYKPYLHSNLQLINEEGVITSSEKNTLKVEFSKRDTESSQSVSMFSYAFERGETKKALMPTYKDGIIQMQISIKAIKSDYLTIYGDNRPLTSFKIKMSSY
ncbi:transglutaminase domain-containing protein [Labilibacter marinus]|uniref:transglutaminase domain-containing protein n=1 Tax=Labilibacter marinus TaxID=1477105 RepID=UPI00094FA608|nr:transglutaminase domain-containing protein [Labilibacter marinus]